MGKPEPMNLEPKHVLRLEGEKTNVFKCKAPLCLIPSTGRVFSEDNIYSSMTLLACPISHQPEEVNAALIRGEKVAFENSDDSKGILHKRFIVSAEFKQNGEQPHYLVSFVKAEIAKAT